MSTPLLSRRALVLGGMAAASTLSLTRPARAAAGTHHGIFIGINEYRPPLSRLAFCDNDAREMHSELCTSSCSLIDKEKGALVLNAAATRGRIMAQIADTHGALKDGDSLVIYWASHGARPVEDEGELYLITADTVISGQAARKGDFENVIRFVEDLVPMFQKKQNFVSVILDGCQVGDALARPIIADNKNIGLLAASKRDENALEDPRLKHGVFTYHLLETLRTAQADADGNGLVTLEEAYAFTYRPVLDYVAKHYPQHRQYPTVAGNNIHRMTISKKADAAAARRAAAAAPSGEPAVESHAARLR